MSRWVGAVLVAALVALGACNEDGSQDSRSDEATTSSATAASAEVDVTDAWARSTAPEAERSAVYMSLRSDEDDALLEASVDTSIAGSVEIHETTDEGTDSMDSGSGSGMEGGDGGAMQGMREVEQIELPGGEIVELEPGGYHIMLVDLRRQLTAGEEIEVTLTFERAGEQTVKTEVKDS